MTNFFLDTSAHIERHAGDMERRVAVEDHLSTGDAHATSTHVHREWRHIVEGAAIDVLNAIGDDATDFRDVWAKLSQGYGRAAGQRLRVLGLLAGQELDLESLRIRAQTFLRTEASELFIHEISVLRDGSECGLARETVEQHATGRRELRTKCSKKECVCRQPEFLEDRRSEVESVGTALRQADNAPLRNLGRTVAEVMAKKDPIDRKGKNCWGGLGGDVSIALECAPGETLLTTDRSFDVICPTLGIQHERISATPPP